MPIPELSPEDMPAEIKLNALGLTFTGIPPVELNMWGTYPLLPAGTLLIGTGTGGWAWGERLFVHEFLDGEYIAVDLRRAIPVSMPAWEVAASFYRLFSAETYPYSTLEEAVAAARKSIPLFALPAATSITDA